MVTPDPRGFPRHSNTAQVLGLVQDARCKSRRHLRPDELPPERPLDPDLARLFDLRHRKPAAAPVRELDRTPTATVDLHEDVRQLFIPTGEHHVKKDGTKGAEHKIPFLLVTVTATIMYGKHRAFFYRVTNRATKVEDSRYPTGRKPDGEPTYARKPLIDVLEELHRLCPPAIADSTAEALAAQLQPPRERKPRKRKLTVTDETANTPPDLRNLKRVGFSARKHLLGDPLLDYLNQPLPFPDVKIS